MLLLALVEARTKEDHIYEQLIINLKAETTDLILYKIYKQIEMSAENSKDRGKQILRLQELNHVLFNY